MTVCRFKHFCIRSGSACNESHAKQLSHFTDSQVLRKKNEATPGVSRNVAICQDETHVRDVAGEKWQSAGKKFTRQLAAVA